jgi:hypothetical protein
MNLSNLQLGESLNKVKFLLYDKELKWGDYENISSLFEDLALSPTITKEQLVANVKSALGIEDFSELQVEVKFGNGKKIKVELENEVQDTVENNSSETEND